MRNIKKKIKVQEVECLIYDREKKEERTEVFTVAEVEKAPDLPANSVLIEQKVLSEKEVTYSMSPQTFVKHAKLEN